MYICVNVFVFVRAVGRGMEVGLSSQLGVSDYCKVNKGLSKNYVIKTMGMKSTRFSALAETLFSSELS